MSLAAVVDRQTAWTGDDLLRALTSMVSVLEAHVDQIDALNVFPVPDGDTGTNMFLTVRAALEHAQNQCGTTPRVGCLVRSFAHGALLGARGNSGVILSQVFRGFADALAQCDVITGADLVRGFAGASESAYRAVMQPVEGTMLTVVRMSAERLAILPPDVTVLETLETAVTGASDALARTPEMLPILRQAGVVDSGGQGIVVCLQALLAWTRAEEPPRALTIGGPALLSIDLEAGHDTFGYCTNVLITGTSIPVDEAKRALLAIGQSAVIVGDDTALKIHIHTERPDQVLTLALQWGDLSQIKIENMTTQVSSRLDRPAATGLAIIAVANGDGNATLMRSLGATAVIDGGKTMNPSTDQLLAGIRSSHAGTVVLLPNNGNVLMAAKAAAGIASEHVLVIPTRSLIAGIAALNAISPSMSIEQASVAGGRAIETVTTLEIALAERDVTIHDVQVRCGYWLAVINDQISACNSTITALISDVRASMPQLDAELATVLVGEHVTSGLTDELVLAMAASFSTIEFDVHTGGQPHYAFVIGLE